ncbi:MAG: hypothetical protein ACLP9S_09335 [Syntrophales bacterium]
MDKDQLKKFLAWPHSSPVQLSWCRVVGLRQVLEAVRSRTQVASRKDSRRSLVVAEAVRNRVQLASSGCAECRLCLLRPVCGGCLTSAYSLGFDVLKYKDPYCFL